MAVTAIETPCATSGSTEREKRGHPGWHTGLARNKVSEISKLRIRVLPTSVVPSAKSAEPGGIHLVLRWILVMRLTRLS